MNKPLPNFTDATGRILVPISEASKILGVSQDTLRRWDEKGKIVSKRPDGKNRYFAIDDLENFKSTKKFSIGEASEFLGISPSTLRRLDESGVVVAKREGDDRVYELGALEEFMGSQYFQAKRSLDKFELEANPQEIHIDRSDNPIEELRSENRAEDSRIDRLFSFRRHAIGASLIFLLLLFALVGGIAFSFITMPGESKKLISMFINPKLDLSNINAKYLRDRIPGIKKDNIAYFSNKGKIAGFEPVNTTTFNNVDLESSQVFGILPLSNGGTGADLSDGSPGGIVYMAAGKLATTPALSGILTGNGSSGPTAATGTENFVLRWGPGGKVLNSTSNIYDNGNVGIGNSDPGQRLDVSGSIYARDGQIRIGNFSSAPTAIGAGSLYYDTATTQVYYFNGTTWQVVGSGSGGGFWNQSSGVLYPFNSTVDALIGGQSTASAKFGFINVNSGTPEIRINNVSVLNPTTLGGGVVNSSLTSVGILSGGSIASGFGTIDTSNTITGTTLNGTTGINTGAGGGTQRIDSSGNLVNIGTITSGLINGQTISNAANFTGTIAVAGSASISGALTIYGIPTIQTTANQTLTLGGNTTGNINLEARGTANSGYVLIGSAGTTGGSANPDFLVIDQASGALPMPIDGSIARDSTGKFNIFESGAWKILCNKTDAACGAGSGSALSAISAAVTGNTINSGDNAQVWNWSITTAAKTGFTFGENIASVGSGSVILKAMTIAGSSASPFQAIAQNNTVLNVANTGGITLGANAGNDNVLISPNAGGQAALIVDKKGINDIFTASISGATKFTISSTGALTDAAYTNAGGILYTSTTGLIGQTAVGTNTQCLLGGTTPAFGSCAAGGTDSPFQVLSGAIVPLNSTLDFLIGGQATTSAKFAIIGVNNARGTQTASLSGSLSLDSSTASIQTTNGQTLTLGGDKTGLININNKSNSAFTTFDTVNSRVGIGTTAPAQKLSVAGNIGLSSDSLLISDADNGNYIKPFEVSTGRMVFRTGAVDRLSILYSSGNVGIGITAPVSALHLTHPLSFGATGKALAIFDQIEQQDIFTASAGATPIFTVTRAGGLALGTNGLSFGTATQCLLGGSTASWGSCSAGGTDSPFQVLANTGAIVPLNSTLDFLIGGQATTSAKFAVLGVNNARGTQTASVSGSLSLDSSTASIQTTNKQTLTVGGDKTGDISFKPGNSTSSLFLASSGNVGIGNTAPAYALDISRNAPGDAALVNVVNSGSAGFSGLQAGENGSNFVQYTYNNSGWNNSSLINTALAAITYTTSGSTGGYVIDVSGNAPIIFGTGGTALSNERMRITGTGNIGIGDTSPTSLFTVGNGDLFQVNSSGNLTFNQTSPTVSIGNTGSLVFNDGTNTLCTISDAGTTGNLSCTGSITGASTGTIGYWTRSGTTLIPATSTDDVTIGQTTGRVGIGGAVASDVLTKITADSTQDWNSALTISQANNSLEDMFALNISNTGTFPSLSSGGAGIEGIDTTVTPASAITFTGDNISMYLAGNITRVNDSSKITFQNTGSATANVYGNSAYVDASPVYNNSGGGPGDTYTATGFLSSVNGTPTLTSVPSGSASYTSYAGNFSDSATSAGNANLRAFSYGITVSATGDLTTTGLTLHTGGEFAAAGTADDNIGVNISIVSDATNNTGLNIANIASGASNYAIYSGAAAQSYFAGFVGIGVTSPTAALEVGGGVIFDSSSFTLAGLSGSNNGILRIGNSGVVGYASTTTEDLCLISGSAGTGYTPSWSTCATGTTNSPFQVLSGAIVPLNSTLDFLIGGQATTSAKFAIIGVNNTRGTQTASVSGSLSLDSSTASIQSTNKQTLTVGGDKTGDISFKPGNSSTSLYLATGGNVGIGTTTPTAKLDVAGTASIAGSLTLTNSGNLQSFNMATLQIGGNTTGNININPNGGSGLVTVNGSLTVGSTLTASGTLNANSNLNANGTLSANGVVSLGDNGDNVTINSNTWDITGAGVGSGFTGFASTGTIAFSGAGTFSIDSSAFDVSTGGALSGVTGLTMASGAINLGATNGTATQCLLGGSTASWGSCSAGGTDSPFQVLANTGAIVPLNSTLDFLIGGQATTSAKFAIIGVNGTRGTQTASVSGSLSLDSSTASIQTTNNQTLTIGGDKTGNISILDNTTITGSLTVSGLVSSGGTVSLGDGGDPIILSGTTYSLTTTSTNTTNIADNLVDAFDVQQGSDNYININTTNGSENISFGNATINPSFNFLGLGLLSVADSASISGTLTLGGSSGIIRPATGPLSLQYKSAPNAWTTGLTLDTVGNVGIGTTTPNTTLELGGATGSKFSMSDPGLATGLTTHAATTAFFQIEQVTNDDGGARVWGFSDNASVNPLRFIGAFGSTDPTDSIPGVWFLAGKRTGGTIQDLGSLETAFQFTGGGGSSHYLTILGSGNVGIGTVTPGTTLDVTGTASISSTLTMGGAIQPSTGNLTLNYKSGPNAWTAGITMNTVGNVGIGTTTPAASINTTATRILDLSSSGLTGLVIHDTATTQESSIMSNGAGMFIDIAGSATGANNNIFFRTISTNSNFVPTERVTIDSTGKIGIGTTAPASELHVTRPLSFGTTGKALAIFDQIENQDIFTASKGGVNKFVIDQNGQVGIGTSLPRAALDVVVSTTATAAAIINNSTTTAASVGLAIKMGATTPGTTTHLVEFLDLNGAQRGNIRFANTTTVAYQTSGIADFAEHLRKDPSQNIDWGSIVCQNTSGVVEPCSSSSSSIVGVASEFPTFVGGVDLGNSSITVGLSGVVSTRVSNVNGNIKSGDFITSSDSPGVGVKAIKAGQVVGIALEDLTSAEGKILVRVGPTWFDPDVYLTDSGNINVTIDPTSELGIVTNNSKKVDRISTFSESVVGKLRAGIITATTITTDSLNIKTEQIKIGDKTLAQYIADNSGVGSGTSPEVQSQIAGLQGQIDSLKGVLGTSTQSAELSLLQDTIAQKEAEIAAMQASASAIPNQSANGNLDKLRVTGNGLFEGLLTVLDNLTAQSLIVNSTSTFFGDAVFKGHILLSKDSAGEATIKDGKNEISVKFDNDYNNPPIVNITLSIDDQTLEDKILKGGYVYGVVDRSEKGFSIKLNKPASDDLKFSWTAVERGN